MAETLSGDTDAPKQSSGPATFSQEQLEQLVAATVPMLAKALAGPMAAAARVAAKPAKAIPAEDGDEDAPEKGSKVTAAQMKAYQEEVVKLKSELAKRDIKAHVRKLVSAEKLQEADLVEQLLEGRFQIVEGQPAILDPLTQEPVFDAEKHAEIVRSFAKQRKVFLPAKPNTGGGADGGHLPFQHQTGLSPVEAGGNPADTLAYARAAEKAQRELREKIRTTQK